MRLAAPRWGEAGVLQRGPDENGDMSWAEDDRAGGAQGLGAECADEGYVRHARDIGSTSQADSTTTQYSPKRQNTPSGAIGVTGMGSPRLMSRCMHQREGSLTTSA